MNTSKLVALLAAPLLFLTACSSSAGADLSDPNEHAWLTQDVSWVGLSGVDLSSVKKVDDMNTDDQIMFLACQRLNTYNTGEYLDVDGTTDSSSGVGSKESLRSGTLYQLKLLEPEYPEVAIYYDGVINELASPGSQPDGFRSFTKACDTYLAVLSKIRDYFAPAAQVYLNCWNNKEISVKLQEKVSGTWVTRGLVPKLSRQKNCSDKKYPYSATIYISRTIADDSRTFRLKYTATDGTTFTHNGKSSVTTPAAILAPEDTSIEIYTGF